jgi:hypothetical protein
MKPAYTLAMMFAIAVAPGAFAQPTNWTIYKEDHVSRTIPCDPRPVILQGSHTDINMTGACRYVRVAGEHNDITVWVAPGGTVEITGAHNDVTIRRAPGRGAPPRLLDSGPSNTFHQAEG